MITNVTDEWCIMGDIVINQQHQSAEGNTVNMFKISYSDPDPVCISDYTTHNWWQILSLFAEAFCQNRHRCHQVNESEASCGLLTEMIIWSSFFRECKNSFSVMFATAPDLLAVVIMVYVIMASVFVLGSTAVPISFTALNPTNSFQKIQYHPVLLFYAYQHPFSAGLSDTTHVYTPSSTVRHIPASGEFPA